jgi:hypothetical protein
MEIGGNMMGWWNKLVQRKKAEEVSAKDKATAKGEPYVKVLEVKFDKDKPGDGYFELEWNQIFVKQLLEAGYSGADENEIVDAWFTGLCRTIADEQ